MLCPEVISFKEPASYFTTQTVKSNELGTLKKITNFHFNHLATVILPDSFKVPKSLTDSFDKDTDYYQITNFNVQDLLDVEFVTCFVNSGLVTLLSINNRVDCDTCLCITPTGHLFISLDKESYQELGIQGKVSHFYGKDGSRYIIDIDLNSASFAPGSSLYKRAQECLGKLPKRTVIFTWRPPQEDVCPSSIASYFSKKYVVKLCKLKMETKIAYSVRVPELDPEELPDFIEWLGMVSLDCDLDVKEKYLSSYSTTEPTKKMGQVRIYQWRGLFTFDNIENLVKEVQNYTQHKPWGAIYVQGFSDSPVAWGHEEHHFYTNGDNGYVILTKQDELLLCTQECSKKKYK